METFLNELVSSSEYANKFGEFQGSNAYFSTTSSNLRIIMIQEHIEKINYHMKNESLLLTQKVNTSGNTSKVLLVVRKSCDYIMQIPYCSLLTI